jgi:superfamily II RNA helicase
MALKPSRNINVRAFLLPKIGGQDIMDPKDETKKTDQGAPQNAGQPSAGKDGSTSKAPKTYTEEEVKVLTEKVRSDTLAEAGRKYKPVEDENATLKSQLANNQALIKDTEAKIVKLQQEIEDLAEDDPDKKRLIKRLADLDETERKLKADRTALEIEKTTHAEPSALGCLLDGGGRARIPESGSRSVCME